MIKIMTKEGKESIFLKEKGYGYEEARVNMRERKSTDYVEISRWNSTSCKNDLMIDIHITGHKRIRLGIDQISDIHKFSKKALKILE